MNDPHLDLNGPVTQGQFGMLENEVGSIKDEMSEFKSETRTSMEGLRASTNAGFERMMNKMDQQQASAQNRNDWRAMWPILMGFVVIGGLAIGPLSLRVFANEDRIQAVEDREREAIDNRGYQRAQIEYLEERKP